MMAQSRVAARRALISQLALLENPIWTLNHHEAENGWHSLIEPGLVATKTVGQSRVIACQLDPEKLTGKQTCSGKQTSAL